MPATVFVTTTRAPNIAPLSPPSLSPPVFAQNPLHPIFRKRAEEKTQTPLPIKFIDFDEGIVTIGHAGNGFCYDNEGPQHRALVPPFSLASRLRAKSASSNFSQTCGRKNTNTV